MARTSRERLPKNAHISAFLVPADAEGIEVGKIEKKMGQSGAWISDVIFKNVRVPATSIIGGIEGRGFATAMKSLDRGRINVACVAVGQARRILYEATRYAADREQFGEPIGHYQPVHALPADRQAHPYTAACLLPYAPRRHPPGQAL